MTVPGARRRRTATLIALAASGLALTGWPGPARPVQAATSYPYTIWGSSFAGAGVPDMGAAADSNPVEVGVKFRTDVGGTVTGIRFFKGPGNTGTHVGDLWSGTGTRLATATFSGETATGWQQVNFTSGVAVSPNTTYVAAYQTNTGHYAADGGFFNGTGVDNPPLHALASGVDGGNGVFAYGSSGTFPNTSFNHTNYWVDVVFTATVTTPPVVTSLFPGSGDTGVPLMSQVTANFSEEVEPSSISFLLRDPGGIQVPAKVSYEFYFANRVATLDPYFNLAPNTTYTATLSGATDRSGNAMTSPFSWSFTTAPTPRPPTSAAGQWAPVQGWPIVAIHTAILNTGNLLAWDRQNPNTDARVWNPGTGGFTTATIPTSNWCSGQVQMADGRVMEMGGGMGDQPANPIVNLFSPATGTWTRAADLNIPRWYPAAVRLGDGRILVISGQITETTWADTPEIYDPASNTWTLLSAISTAEVHEDLYPEAFLLPTGKVFVYAMTGGKTFILDPAAQTWTPGPTSPITNGEAVMYRPGKILVSGGAAGYGAASKRSAATIDMTVASPTWQAAASMSFARTYHSQLVLPDGKVLAVGGSNTFATSSIAGVQAAEVWDPAGNTWTTLGSMQDLRMNHSTAALLTDGTVLTAGGGHEGGAGFDYYTAEAFSPPYLFNGPRPSVTSAPASAAYGGAINVGTPDAASITSVNLMGLSAQTHQYNAGSQFVNLGFTASSGSLNVTMPSSTNLASPGYYLLFLVNGSGVPAVAKVVQLVGTDVAPPTVASTTPASGATGVAISVAPAATFNKAVQASTISFTLKDSTNSPVAGTVSYISPSATATFTPSAALASSTTYTATVSGALDVGGRPMTGPYSWSFTTVAAASCPCTIWPGSTTPANPSANDSGSVELGVKFRSDVSGYITGIRFYKGVGNTGTHIGNLWNTGGGLLGSATFTGESASGWQQISFGSSVAVTAGTTYVASYFAPNGHYAYDLGYLSASGVDSPPLHALANSASPNGVYAYAGSSTFPTSTANGNNYWVDVVFSTTSVAVPPAVASTTPASGAIGVAVSVAPTATFNKAVQPSTISFTLKDPANSPVAGTVGYKSSTFTATFTPLAALAYSTTYTATVSEALDLSGAPMTAPYSWSFTTAAPPSCPCTIWPSSATPANAAASDSGSVELGVKFRADVSGYITGIRFYKGAGNTGTHIGNLWDTGGGLLATAGFTGESASGWQQVSFGSSVPVTAGSTYVASYFAPNGHYAYDGGYFSVSGADSPPLHAQANAVSPDGVYSYAGTSSFPTSPGNGANYWVDVVFNLTAPVTPPTVSSTTPAAGATGVAVSAAPTATFNKAVQPSTISFTLKDSASSPVAGTVGYNAANFTATFTPSAALAYSKTYTATVSGVQDLQGILMTAPYSWSFTTAGPPSCPCTIWTSSTTPANAAASDSGSVELGVKFRSDVNGYITGIRFYKGSGNTGTHVGNLWSSTGTLLATATFTGETASGWQQVTFSSPVAVTAGTTYVASYFGPNGHYAYDLNYLTTSGMDTPPLHALANSVSPDGVYIYAGTSSFPTNSGNGTNYWVDVVFTT